MKKICLLVLLSFGIVAHTAVEVLCVCMCVFVCVQGGIFLFHILGSYYFSVFFDLPRSL